jgi:hypothetical protein
MSSLRLLLISIFLVIVMTLSASAGVGILVVKFDCQPPARSLTGPLADSITSNLKILEVPAVSRIRWESMLDRSGFRENDLNYNPPVLSRLTAELGAKGAVYGQVYSKNGLLIMDAYYIEPGAMKPVDIDPMIGYTAEDILAMTWELAVIISQDDKAAPKVVKIEPADSAEIENEYVEFRLYFDEPMNPDSYGITGEPKDMFFTFGDVEYFADDNCFKFNVHLYPGKDYKFFVNGPGFKPFMDISGNVARSFQWEISTR